MPIQWFAVMVPTYPYLRSNRFLHVDTYSANRTVGCWIRAIRYGMQHSRFPTHGCVPLTKADGHSPVRQFS